MGMWGLRLRESICRQDSKGENEQGGKKWHCCGGSTVLEPQARFGVRNEPGSVGLQSDGKGREMEYRVQ